MIKKIKGNLLREFGERRLDCIFQNCNVKCTQGAGIAKQIKERFPEAYEADLEAASRNWNRLGNFSMALLDSEVPVGIVGDQRIYNLYTQDLYVAAKGEKDGCMTDYVAMNKALRNMVSNLNVDFPTGNIRIGCPYMLGCGLAGGDWEIVRMLLNIHFRDSTRFELTIVEWDGTIY